jgi:ketosteroid isomerase-like protein
METWELEARESIRDLVARYNANGDAGRIDPMVELFAGDAVLEVPDETVRGGDAIRGFFRGVAGDKTGHLLRHFTATHQIDVDSPDAARGRCYYAVLTEDGLDHWGRYLDRYRRVAGAWRFGERRVTVDGRVPGGWADRRLARRAPAP